jgi:proteic killer suppression protein
VIRSFRSPEAEAIFNLRRSRRLPPNIQQVALRKLRMLHRSISLNDLRIPFANRLEKLTGDRSGQWSIRINDQWRMFPLERQRCFRCGDRRLSLRTGVL